MKSKLGSILISVALAFGIWSYVITDVAPESDRTYYDIPLTEVGETVLNENNLMITDWSSKTVDLKLSGNRIDLNQLNEANIILKVDLSKIYEPGTHRIDYTISYPGNVASNAFTKESQYPEYITVTVEKKLSQEVPVEVNFTGKVAEGDEKGGYIAHKSNVVTDVNVINVSGPASVVEQIKKAVVTVDLTDRTESVSENYRYMLCDEEGNGVDAAMVTVNVEEVHVDLIIQKTKTIQLAVNVVEGGGATVQTAQFPILPATINVSGSEAALEALGDVMTLGTINLADYTQAEQLTYALPIPEGITNLSGVTEAVVNLDFVGLAMKDIVIENFTAVNVPEGLEAQIITEKLTVTVRGPASMIDALSAEQMTATVDFTGAEVGMSTYRVDVIFAEGYTAAGTLGKPSVSATVQETEET